MGNPVEPLCDASQTQINGHWKPRYGKRLIAQTVDDLAEHEPERVWATFTVGREVDSGFRDITTKQLANAVNHTAYWLESKIGRSDKFEVIAYLGESDLRYAILFFAAVKCGYVFMVPSVRNAEAGHLHVLNHAKCNKLFHSLNFSSTGKKLQGKFADLQLFEVAPLKALLDTPSKHYPYSKKWEDSWKEPVIIAHSSGSTGFPKPITVTNGVFSVYDSLRFIPTVPGRRNQDNSMFNFNGGGKFFNPYPPFHLAGLFAMTYLPLFYTSTVLLGPTDKPPTGKLLSDVMKLQKIRAAWCPPTVIEQLLDIPGGFEQAAELDFIMYTGGPLAPAAGDKLCQVTDTCQLYGSTETGTQVTLIPTRETWQYFEWHPHLLSEMDPVGDGTYEMVIHKNLDQLWFRQIYHTFPELDTYRTKDLFVRHPTQNNLWKFYGRRDDVIVLGNGEKFNPVVMEGVVSGDPLVHGALIVGMKRRQAALIVEPRPDHGLSDKEFIDRIWPTIQKANAEGPGHGRIYPHKVIVADASRPFIRAGKGTIIRRHNIQQYEKEIDAIYSASNEERQDVPTLELPCSFQDIQSLIRKIIVQYLPDAANMPEDADLFSRNLDSLQTTELSSHFKALVKTNPKAEALLQVTTRKIYENPSMDSLARYFEKCLNQSSQSAMNGSSDAVDRSVGIQAAIEKFTAGLGLAQTVVVTGSTGSLGTALLKTLIADPTVTRIYCLDRAADALERHEITFKSHGVENLLSSALPRISFMQANFGDFHLGLSDNDYNTVLRDADVIIHNAWAVNFNQKLESFGPVHLQGVRRFIDLCISSPRKPHLAFVSSVSAVQNWPALKGPEAPVPEVVIQNPLVSLEMGYGESKYVSERMLVAAAESGVTTSILRVGQVGGPLASTFGEWNKTEWFPILLKTSKTLGCLPDTLGLIDWIPVDTLATIIGQIIQCPKESNELSVYNLVNPHKAQWDDLLHVVVGRWGLKTVSFEEWVKALSAVDDTSPDTLKSMPALKVMDFFVNMAADLGSSSNRSLEFITDNGRHASTAMAEIRPIDANAMKTWLDQWNFEAEK